MGYCIYIHTNVDLWADSQGRLGRGDVTLLCAAPRISRVISVERSRGHCAGRWPPHQRATRRPGPSWPNRAVRGASAPPSLSGHRRCLNRLSLPPTWTPVPLHSIVSSAVKEAMSSDVPLPAPTPRLPAGLPPSPTSKPPSSGPRVVLILGRTSGGSPTGGPGTSVRVPVSRWLCAPPRPSAGSRCSRVPTSHHSFPPLFPDP